MQVCEGLTLQTGKAYFVHDDGLLCDGFTVAHIVVNDADVSRARVLDHGITYDYGTVLIFLASLRSLQWNLVELFEAPVLVAPVLVQGKVLWMHEYWIRGCKFVQI